MNAAASIPVPATTLLRVGAAGTALPPAARRAR